MTETAPSQQMVDFKTRNTVVDLGSKARDDDDDNDQWWTEALLSYE